MPTDNTIDNNVNSSNNTFENVAMSIESYQNCLVDSQTSVANLVNEFSGLENDVTQNEQVALQNYMNNHYGKGSNPSKDSAGYTKLNTEFNQAVTQASNEMNVNQTAFQQSSTNIQNSILIMSKLDQMLANSVRITARGG